MAKITEIACCQRCGKMLKKDNLHRVEELFFTRSLCKDCFMKHQRSQWGYW